MLRLFLKLIHTLPLWLKRPLAKLAALLAWHLAKRSRAVTLQNLQWCMPKLSESERQSLARDYFVHNAKLMLEVATCWVGERDAIEQSIDSVIGKAELDQLVAEKAPVIITVPHIGNWELFWHWLQLNYPAVAMYSPAKSEAMNRILIESRTRFGGEPCATDGKGLSRLLRGIRAGKVMMILPDQAPKKGAGVFIPFFGKPAYTMTLLHKLAQKSKARVLLGSCLRSGPMGHFAIRIGAVPELNAEQPLETFNRQLNQAIADMIRATPEQYQWSYKRFKRQPDGSRPYDG